MSVHHAAGNVALSIQDDAPAAAHLGQLVRTIPAPRWRAPAVLLTHAVLMFNSGTIHRPGVDNRPVPAAWRQGGWLALPPNQSAIFK